VRKYNDAILFGAEKANGRLPRSYYVEMDKCLISYKKETTNAKADGRLEEHDSDPLTFTLFRLLMQWAIQHNNPFLWVFGLLQWAFMARSVSISTLAFHNFRVGEDNIIGRYDKHKSDQSGESLHDKHIFGNPFDAVLCVSSTRGVVCFGPWSL
jgi:hypothetical protein